MKHVFEFDDEREAVRAAGRADPSSLLTGSESASTAPINPPVRIHGAPPPPRRPRSTPQDSRNVVPESPPSPAEPGDLPDHAVRGHALDFAPVNSVLCVTTDGPTLATPQEVKVLPKTDPAWRLPLGAEIRKTKDGYRSRQLNPAEPHPDTLHQTAMQAITMFLAHFHPETAR